LLALLAANAITTTGNKLTSVAIPWFVQDTTGSASKTGLAGFFAVLPMAIAGIFGGTLVDRLGFRRMSVLSDLASGLTVAVIPLLYLTVGLPFAALLALVFLGALLDTPGGTARQSLTPDLAARAGMPLARVNALHDGIWRGSILLGPPLAGVLIAWLGPDMVLFLDAATFGVSALLVWRAVPGDRRPAAPPAPYWAEFRAGLAFLRHSRALLWLIGTFSLVNLLLNPLFQVILPIYADEQFGSAVQLGLMVGLFGGGTVVGLLLFGVLGPRLPRRATLLTALTVAGLPLWLLAASPDVWVTLLGLFVMGLAIGPISPIVVTAMFERIPAELRGRVLGANTAIANGSIPFGALIAGFLVQATSIQTTLLVMAGAYLAVSLSAIVNPGFRDG
jgi:MFS family permease